MVPANKKPLTGWDSFSRHASNPPSSELRGPQYLLSAQYTRVAGSPAQPGKGTPAAVRPSHETWLSSIHTDAPASTAPQGARVPLTRCQSNNFKLQHLCYEVCSKNFVTNYQEGLFSCTLGEMASYSHITGTLSPAPTHSLPWLR
ncbi:unnamed protein product [Rangifer tarandus platyrhynchus]|uniref:Uncharacterized protein n=1 Tax=Rangifer tarandus platyrhynchus TaxID=3082113 RepID=A0AC59YQJ8_RANTA